MKKTNNNRKGVLFFTVDTMIAGLIFTLTTIVVISFFISEPLTQNTGIVLNNYVNYVTSTKMETFRNLNLNVYNDQNETDPELRVYQKVAKFQYIGQPDNATLLITNITKNIPTLVPRQFGIIYTLDDALIYERKSANTNQAEINLSFKILTYFSLANDTIIGPNVTSISIWS